MIDLSRPRLVEFQGSLVQEIPCEPKEGRADLAAMALPSLLIQYMNWADRLVAPRPRKVMTWDRFWQLGTAEKHRKVLTKLVGHIEAGDDLKPYLSERVSRFGYVRPEVDDEGKRRGIEWGDKDYALNLYEVHHLHLSLRKRADGWAERTNDLLFVQFNREAAGMVLVGNHKSFDDGSLADAVAEARALGGDTVKGVTGYAMPAKDRNRLQRRGVMTVIPVGDQVVHGGLITTAGTSLYHATYVRHVMHWIEHYETLLDDPKTSEEWFITAGRPQPEKMTFRWTMNYCDFGVQEIRTGLFFQMLNWRR